MGLEQYDAVSQYKFPYQFNFRDQSMFISTNSDPGITKNFDDMGPDGEAM